MKIGVVFLCLMISLWGVRIGHAQLIGENYFEGIIQPSEVWDGSFAFGLNGKSGNSQNLDINLEFNMNREDEKAITDLVANYFYATNDLATTVDRLFTQARQDRKLANDNFSWYYMGSYEWDRFRDFDYRVSVHTGLGILLYEFEDRSLRSRLGAGASREFGGTMDDWIPELQFGLDWERQLTDRTRLYSNFDLFPNASDFEDYRFNLRTGFETLLDEQLDMRLRAFVFNRFDSTPGVGFQENDMDYGLALVFGF